MRMRTQLFPYLGLTICLLLAAGMAAGQTNIAPNGQGYYWYGMKTATATTNQTVTTLINDNNLTNTLNCDPSGETSTNRYEGAGVIFSATQSNITSVAFINGPLDNYGNGNFEANLSLQTYNGSSWSVVSGWTVSPAYPYTSAAASQTYTFSGPALTNVLGVRVVGEVRVASIDDSWSWTVNQVEIYSSATAASFTLSASPSSQSVTAGSSTSYTITAAPVNGFTGTVSLTVGGLPTGASGTFSPSSIGGGSGSSTLNVSTTSSTAAGSYTLTVTGTSGSLTETTSVTLTVASATGSCTAYTGSNGASFTWSGVTWNIDPAGNYPGGGSLQSSGNNISVDTSCNLHMTITTSSAAEMWSSNEMGFGTYQWVLSGTNYYNMDPHIVVGLFPYGPANNQGKNGQNEIDVEFSNWDGQGGEGANQNLDFTVYPSTYEKGHDIEQDMDVPPPSTATTTARFVWSSTEVQFYLMAGTIPITSAPSSVIQSANYVILSPTGSVTSSGTGPAEWTFTGNGAPSTWIPQGSYLLGMNLWNYNGTPSTGTTVVYQSFGYLAP
jgi:outer membrane lipoprotein SlyB